MKVSKGKLEVKVRFTYGRVVRCAIRDRFVVAQLYRALSDVSEEEDGGEATCSYLIDSQLDASELFSLSEVVSDTPVVELASALQFKHCQCYFGFSTVGW